VRFCECEYFSFAYAATKSGLSGPIDFLAQLIFPYLNLPSHEALFPSYGACAERSHSSRTKRLDLPRRVGRV
jgi:hypothetical protein